MSYRVEYRADQTYFPWFVTDGDGQYVARFMNEEAAREWADHKNENEEVNE